MIKLNEWTISGNLGQEPEVRYTQTGTAICNLSVGCSRYVGKGNDDKPLYKTDWFKAVAFKQKAEYCGNNLVKGMKVTIHGSGQNEEWEKDGVKHSRTVIFIKEIEFEKKREAKPAPSAGGYDVSSFGTEVFDEEQIPF